MDVIEIIVDMFETKQTNMLSFESDFGTLRRLVPNIFREGLDWKHWCNRLSEDEISWVRTNRDSLDVLCTRYVQKAGCERGSVRQSLGNL